MTPEEADRATQISARLAAVNVNQLTSDRRRAWVVLCGNAEDDLAWLLAERAELLRRVAASEVKVAEAWNQGWNAGWDDEQAYGVGDGRLPDGTRNPYLTDQPEQAANFRRSADA